jgi:GxxExxY protein
MNENELSYKIIGAAIHVHKKMGPGLLESAYVECLAYELLKLGLQVERQVGLPLVYEGVNLECGYRLDLLINKKVIIEVKAVESLSDIHTAHLLTYLRLSGRKLGLLINFNVLHVKTGINRVVNSL